MDKFTLESQLSPIKINKTVNLHLKGNSISLNVACISLEIQLLSTELDKTIKFTL